MKGYSRLAIISVVALISFEAQAGGTVCAVIDPIWQSGHDTAQSTIIQAADQMVATFAMNSTQTTEELVSAVKVLTRADAIHAEQSATAASQSFKAVADTFTQTRMKEEVLGAYETYGAAGQAVDSCSIITKLASLDNVMQNVESGALAIMQSGQIDGSAGSTVTPEQALRGRAQIMSDPVKSGQSVNVLAFLDADTESDVKDAFMNNLVGIPPSKPSSIDRADQGFEFMRARQIEALRSPAIASLAVIRSSSEADGHAGGGAAGSFDEHLDWLIARYGGGEEYETWSASLVTKSETGLLKEIARLRSISVRLQQQLGAGSNRRQAIVAGLLAAQTVGSIE